jgi:hypothetical protein
MALPAGGGCRHPVGAGCAAGKAHPHAAPQDRSEIRDAVRALCAQFPEAHHRQVDEVRADREAFVDALNQTGWLPATCSWKPPTCAGRRMTTSASLPSTTWNASSANRSCPR